MLRIADKNRLALEANPAAVSERSQGLVHGLARSANELRNFFLREVVVNPQSRTLLAAETVS